MRLHANHARLVPAAVIAVLLALTGCSTKPAGGHRAGDDDGMHTMPPQTAAPSSSVGPEAVTAPQNGLPGMPPLLDPKDVYAADRPNALADAVKNDLPRVYVPNMGSNTVSVIDPATMTVIETIKVGKGPQHVVPSWDLRTLWVNNNIGNSLTPIDPATGKAGAPVPVDDPYNLYFTPDGKYAMVMEEALHKIVFADPRTLAVRNELKVDCDGVNHADFSPDGRYFIASCEFSGHILKVDTEKQVVLGQIHLPGKRPMPQDVKVAPDGATWYIADMQSGGVWMLDGENFTPPTLLPTGDGAHGLYVSRDSKYLYIANRGEGSVSVLEFATKTLVAKWKIPGGGSPDMGGLSADGKVLWLSGRYHGEVYAIDTTDGHLIKKIKTGTQPHGLCVWPQPGRYSLGHTGILR